MFKLLEVLNQNVVQHLHARLFVQEEDDKSITGFGVLLGVTPNTGWTGGNDYSYSCGRSKPARVAFTW